MISYFTRNPTIQNIWPLKILEGAMGFIIHNDQDGVELLGLGWTQYY